jgi:hypothetical protein
MNFLQDAVDMNSIFILFTKLLPQDSTNRLLMGIDYKLLDKVINAYNNVYPGFSETLDSSFKEFVSSFVPSETCDHEWHDVRVHKVGNRYECRKCQGLAKEEDFEPVSY